MFVSNMCRMFLISVMVPILSTGCTPSKSGEATVSSNIANPQTDVDNYRGDPVELVLQDYNAQITDDEFEKFFAQPVLAKYPNISLKLLKGAKLSELIASGSTPDLIAISNPNFIEIAELEVPEDLNPMLKQMNVDLNRIEPAVIGDIKKLGQKGEFFGLPFGMNYGAMIYNKDIFDKFGVPYPKDMMTWEEVFELGKQMTRTDVGVQYFGIGGFSIANMLKQYGVHNIDDQDRNAIFTTEGHKYVFSKLQQLYRLPGYVDLEKGIYSRSDFYKAQTLVMMPNWINGMVSTLSQSPPPFNWDLTTFPSFQDRPNLGNPVDFHMLSVAKTSKHKDAAYRVMLTVLSEQVQLGLSKNGRLSVLRDEKIKAAFAENSGVFKGKNLNAVFKVSPSPVPEYSIYKTVTAPFIDQIAKEIALNQTDLNTALREAEMKANQAIQANPKTRK